MTDTTDIKTLRESAIKSKELSGIANYRKGDEAKRVFNAMLSEDLIIKLLDQLEAERQRADNLKKPDPLVGLLRSQLKNAKAEIAAMKGDQVPVAWKLTHITGAVSVEFNKEVADLFGIFNGNTVQPLYDRPQKPIVLPKSHYVCGCADRFMSELEVRAAIEAAGGIVKDGE